MAEQEPNAGPTPEDVQRDMQATRAHLGAGVEALGARAAGYAHDAADAVGGAYQGALDALHGVQRAAADGATSARRAVADTVAFTRRAVDIRRHVRQHPWAALGIAVAAGFACGRFLTRR